MSTPVESTTHSLRRAGCWTSPVYLPRLMHSSSDVETCWTWRMDRFTLEGERGGEGGREGGPGEGGGERWKERERKSGEEEGLWDSAH